MTALALNYSTKVYSLTLKPILTFLWSILRSLGYSIASIRQMQANIEVARYLQRTAYPNEAYETVLWNLNQKTQDRLNKEFYGD